MEIYAKEFWLPKRGSTDAEYEDASSISDDRFRFAVADGATETSFSGIWARQLVRAFTNRKLSIPIAPDELKPLQSRWEKIVHRHPLPWYAEEKASSGAFAAFVGLELTREDSGTGTVRNWRAIAAGDSCLIQIRGEEVISFPLSDFGSFSSRPNLLSSSAASNGIPKDLFLQCTGSWGCDDAFFLMTDALACWFLKRTRARKQTLEFTSRLGHHWSRIL